MGGDDFLDAAYNGLAPRLRRPAKSCVLPPVTREPPIRKPYVISLNRPFRRFKFSFNEAVDFSPQPFAGQLIVEHYLPAFQTAHACHVSAVKQVGRPH
jgi:hypothetical protein